MEQDQRPWHGDICQCQRSEHHSHFFVGGICTLRLTANDGGLSGNDTLSSLLISSRL